MTHDGEANHHDHVPQGADEPRLPPMPPPPPQPGPALPAPPPGTPPLSTNLQAPKYRAPEPTHRAAPSGPGRGLVIAACIVVALAALAAFNRGRLESTAGGVGRALGTTVFVGGIAWLVARRGSTRTGLVTAVVLGALALLGNAADNISRSAEIREIQEAFEAEGITIDDDADVELTDAEIACFDASGLEPEDLVTAFTDTSVTGGALQMEFFDVTARCAPRIAKSDANVETFRTSLNNSIAGEISTEEAGCMLGEIVDHGQPSELVQNGDDEAWMAIAELCLGPESFDAFMATPGSGPQSIGDDPRLDRLADRCRRGSEPACDVLYATTAIDSEYWRLGEDCAGRGLAPDALFCTPGIVDADENGLADAASPGWDAIFDDCRAGDMISCDFAYAASELGSEAERVGETCGERRAVTGGTPCVERFPEADV